MKQGPDDDMWHSLQRESLLLNRERRDLLARINRRSVESYAYQYMEVERVHRIPGCQGIMDWMIEWLDNNLILSQSGDGWRGDAVTRVLTRSDDQLRDTDGELELTGKGLKNHV